MPVSILTKQFVRKKVIRNDEAGWLDVENDYEPIIYQAVWDTVREFDRFPMMYFYFQDIAA